MSFTYTTGYKCRGCSKDGLPSPGGFCSRNCYVMWYRRMLAKANRAWKKAWR